jgi:hypothetical protein
MVVARVGATPAVRVDLPFAVAPLALLRPCGIDEFVVVLDQQVLQINY